jgi:hypothetical protein
MAKNSQWQKCGKNVAKMAKMWQKNKLAKNSIDKNIDIKYLWQNIGKKNLLLPNFCQQCNCHTFAMPIFCHLKSGSPKLNFFLANLN